MNVAIIMQRHEVEQRVWLMH